MRRLEFVPKNNLKKRLKQLRASKQTPRVRREILAILQEFKDRGERIELL